MGPNGGNFDSLANAAAVSRSVARKLLLPANSERAHYRVNTVPEKPEVAAGKKAAAAAATKPASSTYSMRL